MASGKSAGSAKNTASGKEQQANGLGEELESAATEASESVQEAAGELTQTFRQQITSQITAQQERAVDMLDTVALLFQQAGEHARKEDKATIAHVTDQASEHVERLSNAVRDREPDQLLTETKQLAQKQPGLFVGGALLAGFLGARFLRSSAQAQQQQESSQSSGAADGSQATPDSGTDTHVNSGASAAPHAARTETSIGTGAVAGVTDASALEGTILEKDAAILEELEREEMVRQEDEGLGGGSDKAAHAGSGSETR